MDHTWGALSPSIADTSWKKSHILKHWFRIFQRPLSASGIHETNSDVKKSTMCVGVKKNVYFLFFFSFFFLPIWNMAQIIYLDEGQEKERLAKTTTSQTLISFRPRLK